MYHNHQTGLNLLTIALEKNIKCFSFSFNKVEKKKNIAQACLKLLKILMEVNFSS